jgi:hypothetical protein
MADDAARAAVDIITGSWRAQALYAATALNIPDLVAAGHTDSRALATTTDSTRDGIERLMRLLVSMGVFAGAERTGYRLTAVGETLRSDVDGSLRDMCQSYGEESYRAWGSVVSAIRTGQPGFRQAFGVSLHDYLATTPGAAAKFQRSMTAGSGFFADLTKVFDFSGCRVAVDVAGGGGLLLGTVLRECPDLRGVLFDLPHVVPIGRQQLADMVSPDRVDVVAGDMFEHIPPGGDVYLLSRVLQDWDDARCLELLGNCRAAMAGSARLLIIERVIPEDGSAILPLLWDLHLLVMAGGRERPLAGYRSLLAEAGLRLASVHSLALETSLLVAVPDTATPATRQAWSGTKSEDI